MRKVSSQISLCSPHFPLKLDIRYEENSFKRKNTIKSECVAPYWPVQTAQANLGRHFTHTPTREEEGTLVVLPKNLIHSAVTITPDNIQHSTYIHIHTHVLTPANVRVSL